MAESVLNGQFDQIERSLRQEEETILLSIRNSTSQRLKKLDEELNIAPTFSRQNEIVEEKKRIEEEAELKIKEIRTEIENKIQDQQNRARDIFNNLNGNNIDDPQKNHFPLSASERNEFAQSYQQALDSQELSIKNENQEILINRTK